MPSLVLLPALLAEVDDAGRVGVTGKFLSGLEAFAEAWDGPLRVLMERADGPSGNLDDTLVDPASFPFEVEVVDYAEPGFVEGRLHDAGVVLGALGMRQNTIPLECAERGIPFVGVSEYTLRTRRQIVFANTQNPILRARRLLWEVGQERANRRAVRAMAGVQCNGTPTYEAYRKLNAQALLYFDTRTREGDLIRMEALDARLHRMLDGHPLQLVFSGRLNRMKGAPDLPRFAAALKARGVRFHLSVCGGGASEGEMREAIETLRLGDVMTMKGVLDFQSELVPFVREHADLFVCPHVQGDPSCTYMETFACGVPVAGYDNEAFRGLYELASIGWKSALGDPEALAAKVADIDRQRPILAARSRAARSLAEQHTMEATFRRRLAHLSDLTRS